MGLLRRNPEQRLSGPEALRGLARDTAPPASETRPAAIRDPPFVGRDRQLHVLNDAFAAVIERGRGGRVGPRSVRHRQERAGAALSQPVRHARRRRRALRPLLRERVGALQGARWSRRRPEPLSRVDSTAACREADAARRGGVDASVPRAAAGGRRSPTRAGIRSPGASTRLVSGAGHSRRCASCWPARGSPAARRLDRRPAVGRRR